MSRRFQINEPRHSAVGPVVPHAPIPCSTCGYFHSGPCVTPRERLSHLFDQGDDLTVLTGDEAAVIVALIDRTLVTQSNAAELLDVRRKLSAALP